jgi:hypothetical protein
MKDALLRRSLLWCTRAERAQAEVAYVASAHQSAWRCMRVGHSSLNRCTKISGSSCGATPKRSAISNGRCAPTAKTKQLCWRMQRMSNKKNKSRIGGGGWKRVRFRRGVTHVKKRRDTTEAACSGWLCKMFHSVSDPTPTNTATRGRWYHRSLGKQSVLSWCAAVWCFMSHPGGVRKNQELLQWPTKGRGADSSAGPATRQQQTNPSCRL